MNRLAFKLFTVSAKLIFFFVDYKLPIICFTSFTVIVSVVCPVRAAEVTSRICRVCGATTTQTDTYCLNLPVSSKESFEHRRAVEKLYNAFIDKEHEHDWCNGYKVEKTGTMFAWGTKSISMKNPAEDSSIYQPRLTHIALVMGYNFRYSSLDLRRRLHQQIISSLLPDEYYEVCALYDKTPSPNWQENWKTWLNGKETGDPASGAAVTKFEIPVWATSSASHIPNHMEIVPGKLKERSDYSRNWFYD